MQFSNSTLPSSSRRRVRITIEILIGMGVVILTANLLQTSFSVVTSHSNAIPDEDSSFLIMTLKKGEEEKVNSSMREQQQHEAKVLMMEQRPTVSVAQAGGDDDNPTDQTLSSRATEENVSTKGDGEQESNFPKYTKNATSRGEKEQKKGDSNNKYETPNTSDASTGADISIEVLKRSIENKKDESKAVPQLDATDKKKEIESNNNKSNRTTGRDADEPVVPDISNLVDMNSPAKLTANGQIDWSQYDSVYFYHTRKAGGTTLIRWTRAAAWKHNKTFDHEEGVVHDHERWDDSGDRVLFVTALRPPVDRVLSSYVFDEHQSGRNWNRTLSQFVQKCNDANTYKKRNWYDKKIDKLRGWIWSCASECYSKWFGTWPTPDNSANVEKAAETLNSYEIIWMKNLGNEQYMNWLRHRMNATDIPMIDYKKSVLPRPNFTNDQIQVLKDVNQKDAVLYNLLKTKWEHMIYQGGGGIFSLV